MQYHSKTYQQQHLIETAKKNENSNLQLLENLSALQKFNPTEFKIFPNRQNQSQPDIPV